VSPAREELSPRRRQILAAATTVLAQQGNRGLTHPRRRPRGGLSEGSSSAYFRTRDALLRALGDVVADRLAADVAALVRSSRRAPVTTSEPSRRSPALLAVARRARPPGRPARADGRRHPRPGLAERFTQWRDDLVAPCAA
jgi:AcrR family transcriptional regulator